MAKVKPVDRMPELVEQMLAELGEDPDRQGLQATPDRVARVVRNAERGCFVMQALQNPVPVTGRTFLNGALLGDDGGSVRRQ